jgi:hypothetical protein
MTEQAYTGFRFRWDRPDANAPNGVNRMHCFAVARSLSEAQSILEETVTGSLLGVDLINSGPDILDQARAVGLRDGEGKVQ